MSRIIHLLLLALIVSWVKCLPPPPQSPSSSNNDKLDQKLINTNKGDQLADAAKDLVSQLAPSEAKTISIIMNTLMPSMFNLFSNITSDEYKANFKSPCRFDELLDIFKQMPPLFDKIANKYPTKPDLVAYYSMQLASTFLVNNGSLTMACLYNMLSLQTRLMSFSIDIMDNPEKNPDLVGLFGIFMKPVMSMLKKNAMMQIIEHVDRYDKNDDLSNVALFNFLNVFYCLIGLVGILSNVFLVILLRRSSTVVDKQRALTLKRTMEKLNEKHLEATTTTTTVTTTARNTSQKMMIQNASGHKLQSSLSGKAKVTSLEKPELRSKKRVINTSEEIVPIGDKGGARLKIKNELATHKSHHKSSRSHQIESTNKHNGHHKRQNHSKSHSAHRKQGKRSHKKSKQNSKYKIVKKTQIQLNYIVNKRYNTRICFIIIAICHSIYLFMNFMVMSQASIAAMGLQSISKLNMACKISFMLFPPTTAYTFLHQLAIWLLVFALRQHAIKLRTTPTHTFDDDNDYEVSLMKGDFSDSSELYLNSNSGSESNDENSSYSDDDDDRGYNKYKGDIYNSFDERDDSNNEDEEEDTVSQSLTNNSQPSSTNNQHASRNANSSVPLVSSSSLGQKASVQFMDMNNSNTGRFPIISQQNQQLMPASMLIMSSNSNPYNTNLTVALPNVNTRYVTSSSFVKSTQAKSTIAQNRKNITFCIFLFVILFTYNAQNLFLYSLSELPLPDMPTIYYCAFEQAYSEYYTVLNQYVIPLSNLVLFAALPLALATMQVLFDICFLVRVQREQMKRYLKLRDIIEWPIYIYYLVYLISQLPFALHQVNDLIMGTVKFPFVFPLFIQLKFTSKVWLTVIEMTLLCLACSTDLYIWIICDREVRQLAKYWLNKRIFCRTYAKTNKKKLDSHTSSSRSCSGSSSRSDSNSVEMCERNINISKNPAVSSTSTAMTAIVLPPSNSLLNQPNTHNHNTTNNNSHHHHGYASSTLSSTTSSHNQNHTKKKSISPIIASATLSASNTTNELVFEPPNSPVSKNQVIRMIDTDNEDVDVSNDSSEPIRLDKLDEEDKQQIALDTSINAIYEKNMHPPSFKTAISSRPLFSSNFSQQSPIGDYRHQYQNDIDLNIHPSTLPKIVQNSSSP